MTMFFYAVSGLQLLVQYQRLHSGCDSS